MIKFNNFKYSNKTNLLESAFQSYPFTGCKRPNLFREYFSLYRNT